MRTQFTIRQTRRIEGKIDAQVEYEEGVRLLLAAAERFAAARYATRQMQIEA